MLEFVTRALLLSLRPEAKSSPFFRPGTSLKAGLVTMPLRFGLLPLKWRKREPNEHQFAKYQVRR